VTDPARTITIPIRAARRIADLLDYLSDMAEHAEDHIDDADDRMELIEERAAGRHWAIELRNAAPQPPAPYPPAR
jgi:hypothetical protein